MEQSPCRGSIDGLFRGKKCSASSHAWDGVDSLCTTTPPMHASTWKALKVRLWGTSLTELSMNV